MNQVQIAAKLYECRDIAKTLLGTHYKRDMDLWAIAIRGEAASRKCTDLSAAIAMSKEAHDEFGSIVILAAVVEMTEPSANASSTTRD